MRFGRYCFCSVQSGCGPVPNNQPRLVSGCARTSTPRRLLCLAPFASRGLRLARIANRLPDASAASPRPTPTTRYALSIFPDLQSSITFTDLPRVCHVGKIRRILSGNSLTQSGLTGSTCWSNGQSRGPRNTDPEVEHVARGIPRSACSTVKWRTLFFWASRGHGTPVALASGGE